MVKKRSAIKDERAARMDGLGWKDKLKRQLELIHVCNPKYIFLTESAAISNGYVLKEAWKKAYPNEKPPIFYRVNPRVINALATRGGEYKKVLEDFFRKRIKDRDAGIMVYDEMGSCDSSMGLKNFLKNPEKYRCSPDLKCSRVFLNVLYEGDAGYRGSMLEALQSGRVHLTLPDVPKDFKFPRIAPEKIEDTPPELKHSNYPELESSIWNRLVEKFQELCGIQISPHYGGYITSKNSGKSLAFQSPRRKYAATYGESEIDHGLRGVIIGNREFVGFCKTYGKELGEELHEELQRQQQREDLTSKVAGFLAIGGFVASLFFMASNFTGNVIGNLNSDSTSAIGIILFLVGMVGTFFYFKRKK